MKALLIFPGYVLWHYSVALRDIWHVWVNLLWHVNRTFSILPLLRSLFAPWRRVVEGKPAHFNLEQYAEALVANIMSRVVGALLRTVIILAGCASMLLTFAAGLLVYGLWLVAPVLVVALIALGTHFTF